MSGITTALSGMGGAATYNIDSTTYTDSGGGPTNYGVTWSILSDGTVFVQEDQSANTSYDWIDPKPPGSTHYVRVVVTAGAFNGSSSATNSWLSIGSPSWRVEATNDVFQEETCTFTVEIATDSGGTNIVHGPTSVTIEASVIA